MQDCRVLIVVASNQMLFVHAYYADSPYRSKKDEEQLHAAARVLRYTSQRQNHAEGTREESLEHPQQQ